MYHRLKEVRKRLGMNQVDFSKRLGLSQSTLAMLEVGKRSFNDKHVKLVCSTYGVSEHWLRTGEGEMFGSSPYEKEIFEILDGLRPESQQYLLNMARELMRFQSQLQTGPSDQ